MLGVLGPARVSSVVGTYPMRIRVTICLAALLVVMAVAAWFRTMSSPRPSPLLMFSGFTNGGRIAVFTLTNPSPSDRLVAWLAGGRPNSLGDCQIKTLTGDWIDCSETTRSGSIRAVITPDGSWVQFRSNGLNYGPVAVHASTPLTLPPRGSLRVEMEVPKFVPTVRNGNVESNIAELHAPWRAGVRCAFTYAWPNPVDCLLACFRRPDNNPFSYPPGTFKGWSGEVPR